MNGTTGPARTDAAGQAPPIVLASSSPRRIAMLRDLGIPFHAEPASIPETPATGETAETFALRIAEEKALVVSSRHSPALVIGADTVVVVDGEILGKPGDGEELRAMLRKLSGRAHSVVSAIAVVRTPGPAVFTGADSTRVEFAPLSEEEVAWYAATGEPADKAGGYALQGLAAFFITRIEGSPSGVIGLPLSLLYTLAASAGVDLRKLSGRHRCRPEREGET